MDEDIDSLSSKLQEHESQLAEVEAMLEKSPEDEMLLKLHQDLSHVIQLTHDLTARKNGKVSEPDQSIEAEDDDGPPPLPGELQSGSGIMSISSGDMKWTVGDRCMALWEDGQFYHARIDSVKDEQRLTVTFLAYGNQVDCSVGSLRVFKPAPETDLKPGALVRAIYPMDGLFYDATIVEKGDAGFFRVRFSKYKKNVKKKKKLYDIPAYDLLMREANAEDDDEDLPNKPLIPDHLKSTPEDTEAQRLAKRKKVKLLKQRHREKVITKEGQRKQNNWLGFHQGVSAGVNAGISKKKKLSEAIGYKFIQSRKSIFASPQSVSGRVGVTGSDSEMTPDGKRVKHIHHGPSSTPSPFLPPTI